MLPLMIGMMAAGAAAGIGSGLLSKGGADAAAAKAAEAAKNADYIRHRNEANLSSWFQSGQGAQGLITNLLGLGNLVPDGQGYGGLRLDDGNWQQDQENALQRFSTSPDYNFRLQQGQKALDMSAASRGTLLSGKQVKASQQYGGDLASGEYNNWFNKLAGVSGQGLSAANSENSSNLQATGLQNNALIQQGGFQQAGANAMASGLQNAFSNAASIYGFGAGGGMGGGTSIPAVGNYNAMMRSL